MSDSSNQPEPTSFTELRERFASGQDSPRDYLERCLARISARDGVVQAFVVTNVEAARAAADAASGRYRTGTPLSAMDGCPVGIKDIIETADMPTQMNSPHFEGWQSGRDAACVRALRAAGAVIVGKTHTTEFAIGRSAPTTNPHDASRTPGGSSSGSAAAAGDGMVPVALGTQTAGSVLRPASFCGAVGFKPTHGTLSVAGIHPLSRSLDHLGVLTGSLEDAWCAAHTIWSACGADAPGKGVYTAALPTAKMPGRGLVWLKTAGWAELDSASEAAFERYLDQLRAAGLNIYTATDDPAIEALETLVAQASEINEIIVRFEVRYPMCLYRDRDESKLGKRIRGLLSDGDAMTAREHAQGLERRQALIAQVAKVAAAYDGFITLASSGPAPQGFAFTGPRTFLAPWSVVGGPAFSLPLLKIDGLPLGVQLMGAQGADNELAAIAAWMTRAG